MKICLLLFLSLRMLLLQPDNNPENLANALKLAEQNRQQLEKVISHYATDPADSLKLEAAHFLIANMPGHHYWDSKELEEYIQKIDAMKELPYFLREDLHTIPYRYWPETFFEKKEDIKTIDAKYLIHQIDLAFTLRDSCPWLQEFAFKDFCEYILPYKLNDEKPDFWRDSILQIKELITSNTHHYDDRKYSVYNLIKELDNAVSPSILPRSVIVPDPIIGEHTLDCIDLSYLQLCAYRGLGIPAAIDFVPCWANLNGSHYWCVPMDPRFKDACPHEISTRSAAKIYRQTYSIQPILQAGKNEFIPPLFQNPFITDVTEKYVNTAQVTLPLPKSKVKFKHAYLAVFNNLEWKPVCWSQPGKKKICFTNLGRGIVYLPVYYAGTNMKNLNYPFILNQEGRTQFLIPDTVNTQKLHLTRKYPIEKTRTHHNRFMQNSTLQGALDSSFQQIVTASHIKQPSIMAYHTIRIRSHQPYQYLRYLFNGTGDIAELQFYDQQHTPIKPSRILSPNTNDTRKAFDNDPLSYTSSKDCIVIDFGKPVTLSEVRILPRNDANGIYPDNTYELLYYGQEGWRSLGIRKATQNSIEFDHVPTGALYWLRNRTRGREERIFTYENGVIRFW